ncbi:hypothetical protein G6O69_06870 [Pseudenhygromyxa sp. WMMC2535]|uniref:hypothetical protein n=1 Tax=Pseudenhygromyxa sp. WMMC2535 TaxID=2712867 RepID=UPI0015524D52|nr:hypothetical protein [Pseudenhygromyxa sp. WMMC2535]NVB37548.1 hypothetical protein [Pseudenhygromyxa sp. WMMC2535]
MTRAFSYLLAILTTLLWPSAQARAGAPRALGQASQATAPASDAQEGEAEAADADAKLSPAAAQRCAPLQATDLLDASERASLAALLCPAADSAPPSDEALAAIFGELVTSNDWPALIALEVARAAKLEPGEGDLVAARRALAALAKNPKCDALGDLVDEQLARVHDDRTVSSPRWTLDHLPRACTEAVGARELASLERVVIVAYYGDAADRFEAVIAEPQPAHLAAVEIPAREAGAGKAQLLVLPPDEAAVLVVDQHDLALPWRRHLAPGHRSDFGLRPLSGPDTLEVSFDAADDGGSWFVVIDGSPLPATTTRKPGRDDVLVGRLEVSKVPQGDYELHFVHAATQTGITRDRGLVSVTTKGTPKERTFVTADLTGLENNDYGLTRLVIDDHCEERGLVPAQIRRLIERYFRQRNIPLKQLDVIVDMLASFAVIESSLEGGVAVGADRLEGSTERQLSTLAGELQRQGVSKLMTLSVSCTQGSENMVVVGQVIDLVRFFARERDPLSGVDVSEILDAATATVESRQGRRQGFEEVLGRLLGQPTVHLDPLPAEIRFQDQLPLSLRVNRGQKPRASFEYGIARVDHGNICDWAHDLAELSTFDEDPLREFIIEDPGIVLRRDARVLVEPGSTLDTGDAELEADHTLLGLSANFDAPLSGPGRYLVWVRQTSGKQSSQAITATCIEVDAHEVTIYGQFGGLTTSRPGALRVERLYYFRFDVGMLYPLGKRGYGRFGGQIGYSHTNYDSSALPSWNDVDPDSIGSVDGDGKLNLHWNRHGFTFAVVTGFDVPLGPCGYDFPRPGDNPRKQRRVENYGQRCARTFHRRWSFSGRLLLGGNFGFHDLSQIPSNFGDLATSQSGSTLVSDFDLEVGVQASVMARLSERAGVYLYHNISVTDLDALLNSDVEPDGAVTNDFVALNVIGVGFAWMRRPR